MFRAMKLWSTVFLLTMVVGGVAAAQGRATITGTVTDSATKAPIAGAQVFVQGAAGAASIGGVSNSTGVFRIAGVPAGTVTVRVRLLGYSPTQRTVSLVAGQVATENFALSTSTARLDLVVVTGTPGGTQLRAIGNVVETIKATDVTLVVPTANLGELLGGRTAGVTILPSTGQIGTGAQVRIRGLSSLSLSNDPIIYIDGVRMDAEVARGTVQRGGGGASRLNDVNTENIESIEVIKGPAAATLYGTEASNGVIQIITKRGAKGKAVWDITTRTGNNWMRNPSERAGLLYGKTASGELVSFNLYDHEIATGHPAIFGTGLNQGYNIGVRGGTDAVRYFNAVSWDDDGGVIAWNWSRKLSLRSNLDLLLSDKLKISTSGSYIRTRTRLVQGGLSIDPFSNLMWGSPLTQNLAQRGFFAAPPEVQQTVADHADNDRTTFSVTSIYYPTTWFTHRLVAGMDINAENNWTLYPRDPRGALSLLGSIGTGSKRVERAARNFLTLDYSGAAKYARGENLQFKTAVGVQYYRREFSTISATGTNFPAIPITTVSGGATLSGTEDYLMNATLGVYVEQQAAWNNRVFLTAAVRGDGNSSFGKQFKAAYYPKLSGAWVISEEPFWQKVKHVKELRLRAAWGAAGTQPGTFDASRLYNPDVGYKDQPSLVPSSFGNPALKPERSEEIEGGFEASLFNGRLDASYSHYARNIKDAIVNKPLPPSLGFPGSQIVNVGAVKGWGDELGANFHAIEGKNFRWDVGGQYSTNGNRIDDLGGLAFITVGQGGQAQNRVGFSIGDIFMYKILSAKIDATGAVTESICDGGTGRSGLEQGGNRVPCSQAPRVLWGHSQPTWTAGLNSTFTFFRVLRLFVQVDGNGGNYMDDTEIRALHNLGFTKAVILRNDPFLQAYRAIEADAVGTYKAGFLKLRELSATYTFDPWVTRKMGASAGSVSLVGRNVMTLWTSENGWNTSRDGLVKVPIAGQKVWDVETRPVGQISSGFQTIMPPVTSATVTIRLTY